MRPILLSLTLAALATAAEPPPNIVLILADDLGRADVGCYGGEIPTPNIDRLAAAGVRFTRAYNASRCCPSRAALMTGLYSHQAGMGHMADHPEVAKEFASPAYRDALAAEVPTVADVLGAAGYRTWLSGKWHLGKNQPAHTRGFQRSFALSGAMMNYFGLAFANFKPAGMRSLLLDGETWPIPADQGFYSTVAFTDWAIERLRSDDRSAPFFLYLAYNAPHWPLHALPEDIARQRGRYDQGYDVLHEQRVARQRSLGLLPPAWTPAPRWEGIKPWTSLTPDEQRAESRRMEVYAAMVDRLDREIGRVLDVLRDTGAERNTLVLFISDNGAEPFDPYKPQIGTAEVGGPLSFSGYGKGWAWTSNTPLRKAKLHEYEGGISAPAVARWPAGIARPGRDIDAPVHLIDIAATCADLARTTWPAAWRDQSAPPPAGVSLRPLLEDGTLPERHLFFEHEGSRAIIAGNWKAVADNGRPWELYDLANDRGEAQDLAAAQSARTSELAAAWRAWADRVGVRPWTAKPPPAK